MVNPAGQHLDRMVDGEGRIRKLDIRRSVAGCVCPISSIFERQGGSTQGYYRTNVLFVKGKMRGFLSTAYTVLLEFFRGGEDRIMLRRRLALAMTGWEGVAR